MPPAGQRIVLIGAGGGGYGDALNQGQPRYHYTYNFDFQADGRAVPSVVPAGLSITAGDIPRRVTAVLDWETPTGRPILLAACAKSSGGSIFRAVLKIQDETFSVEDFRSGQPYTSAVKYRHDGSDADAEVALFCNGSSEDAIIVRKKNGGYVTTDPSSATDYDAKADVLAVVGTDLWRVIDVYKLEKLTINTNPGVEANWFGTRTPVGTPDYPVHTVLSLGGSPWCLKGDGLYRYNPAPSAPFFEPVTPWVNAHPDNGKGGVVDGRGRIYYPTVDGHVLVVSPGRQGQQAPLQFNTFDRNTPWGKATAMTAGPEQVFLVLEPGSTKTQQLGLTVKTFDGGTSAFTDHTSVVT